jgi:hypothetical protein
LWKMWLKWWQMIVDWLGACKRSGCE